MNDIKRLLAAALNEENPAVTPSFDPADDIARGRRRLVRRRTAVAGGVAAAALLVGGGAWASLDAPADRGTRIVTAVETQTNAAAPETPAPQQITLVAYTGKQPKGYKVERVPEGWVIQGGSESSLVIAPKDAKDTNPDSFVDKLTVLSASSDTPPETLTEGEQVPVGTGTGYYRVSDDGVQIFTYQDASSGRWVQIQVPGLLRWDAARIGEFAAGVTVVGGAGDAHG